MKSEFAALLVLSAFGSHAMCCETGSLRTCADDNGSTYTVNQLGSSDFIQGSNSQAGNSWNANTYRSGSSTNTYGADSTDQAVNRPCNPFGCY